MSKSTLRIVPHPDPAQRVYRSKEKRNDAGVVVRKAGTFMFRYIVQGTEQELARFKVAYENYLVQDVEPTVVDRITGETRENPYYGSLYMSSQMQYHTPRNLIITREGKVAIQEDQWDIDIVQKHKYFADKLGAKAADVYAEKLIEAEVQEQMMNRRRGTTNAQPVDNQTPVNREPQNTPDLDGETEDPFGGRID